MPKRATRRAVGSSAARIGVRKLPQAGARGLQTEARGWGPGTILVVGGSFLQRPCAAKSLPPPSGHADHDVGLGI